MRNVILLIILIFSSFANAEEKSILGYFGDKSYWMDIPAGFYQDSANGNRIGATFLLIPNGYTFNNAPAIIYSSVYSGKTTDEAIKYDVDEFLNHSPGLKVGKTITKKSVSGKIIFIKKFLNLGSKQQPYETVAYIQERGSVVTVVLSAFTKSAFDLALPKYTDMVTSYESSKIKVRHNNGVN